MPYKDPEAKREWELKHRTERLARRRELRRIQATQPQPKVNSSEVGVLILPLLAGGAFAGYSPKLALSVGGLTLLAATYYRKGWQWWFVGALTVFLALVFMKWEGNQQVEKTK